MVLNIHKYSLNIHNPYYRHLLNTIINIHNTTIVSGNNSDFVSFNSHNQYLIY